VPWPDVACALPEVGQRRRLVEEELGEATMAFS
jgi:hypothetical protein